MAHSLHPLFHTIATAPSEQSLRLRLMDSLGECFGVERWGVSLFNPAGELASLDTIGVSDTFLERYQTYGQCVDPVLKYVTEYHAPAHEEVVLPSGLWKQSELYQQCCFTHNHEHIMTGPIVGQGQLIGTVNFARVGLEPAFDQQDLARLGAICTHFSARLAELRQTSDEPNPLLKRLTPREMQIARLVAKGLKNAEIGTELWITQNSVKQALKRMFRKLDVSSRTEMVAKLGDRLRS